jgi:hypothetical protein
MVHPDRQFNPEVDIVGNAITPPERDGVKLMSVSPSAVFQNHSLINPQLLFPFSWTMQPAPW